MIQDHAPSEGVKLAMYMVPKGAGISARLLPVAQLFATLESLSKLYYARASHKWYQG